MNRIFLTGVPGSRWSGIAQEIETEDFNTSDRTPERTYSHNKYSGHIQHRISAQSCKRLKGYVSDVP